MFAVLLLAAVEVKTYRHAEGAIGPQQQHPLYPQNEASGFAVLDLEDAAQSCGALL
jgi:hypothetical protein